MERLKHKKQRLSKFEDRKTPSGFTMSPGASTSVIKGNEKSRLVYCKHCGFTCDRERDVKLKDGSYAGFGINQGEQVTAGSSIGDSKAPAAGPVSGTPDKYYSRTVNSGCPCCGSYLYV